MSREYKGKRIVVWPSYIDATLSRSQGRKISRSDAVRKPRVEEIVEAAEKLGLNPEVEEARYPKQWWTQKRRVVVDKRGSKLKVLRLIARKIVEIRKKKAMLERR